MFKDQISTHETLRWDKEWTNKINIGNVRIYASASNLWTWAAYNNYDPEAVSAGSATQTTPPLKTVTFGLNINF